MTREDAITILKQPDRIGCNLIKANDEESTKYNQESIEALGMAIKALEQQPYEDTISRQAAIDRINKQREHLQPDIYPQDKIGDAAYRICAEFIERLPSAQPEVIRCKDCKWKQGAECVRFADVRPFPSDFCSRAERREE